MITAAAHGGSIMYTICLEPNPVNSAIRNDTVRTFSLHTDQPYKIVILCGVLLELTCLVSTAIKITSSCTHIHM